MTPPFPSDVGQGAMRARLERPRRNSATSDLRIGTTRAARRRQLPTNRCHAALLYGAIRAYQSDSSSKPLHRQPCAGVLGNLHQRPHQDPRHRHKPLDGRSFHISYGDRQAMQARPRLPRPAAPSPNSMRFVSTRPPTSPRARDAPSRASSPARRRAAGRMSSTWRRGRARAGCPWPPHRPTPGTPPGRRPSASR